MMEEIKNPDNGTTNDSDTVVDTCCIEASVVTGFEECARGEAKEKFEVADVKAARGKITWKIPIDNVNEVIKMGSIDNCRVVVHSVPHFGFSSTDQHSDLAGIQKMVPDFDWNTGIRVWKKFNNFEHPIADVPTDAPSRDDLVDVVIIQRPPKIEKSSNKKKKGGKGNKKKEQRKATSENLSKDDKTNENSESCKTSSESGSKEGDFTEKGRVGSVSIDENGTKRVVVKQTDPDEPSPPIEIKVLIPGPDENMFPIDIQDAEQRDLEPMEVDKSMQQAPEDSITPPPGTPPSKVNDNRETKLSPSSPFKQPSSAINIVSAAKDFASSVIERLTTSSSQNIPSNDMAASAPECATPPPTPVQPGLLDSYMKSNSSNATLSSCVDGESCVDPGGSDPSQELDSPSHHTSTEENVKDTSLTKSQEYNEIGDLAKKVKELKPDKLETETTLQSTNSNESNLTSLSPSKSDKSPVKVRDLTKPTFRVTCNRVGDHHTFDSSSAAASLGSAIIRYFGWTVDLKNFDIEVILNIENEQITVSLGITKTSLHNRNLVAFGPTTLRATICYNMIRLCRIRNGDFVCDPLCGTSAIPIEGSMNWRHSFFFGGDYHEMGIARSFQNIDALRQRQIQENRGTMKIDTVQWNIENFPLRDKCVDVFVSDLPFGHRMGNRTVNRTLYPTLLSVMARTAKPGARACLLTEDKTSLIKALQTMSSMWQRRLILSINMGGLNGFVFLLTRTTAAFTAPAIISNIASKSSWLKDSKTSSEHVTPAQEQPKEEIPVDSVELEANLKSPLLTTDDAKSIDHLSVSESQSQSELNNLTDGSEAAEKSSESKVETTDSKSIQEE